MAASRRLDQINGTAICHEERGTGEPLVLVHGAWTDHTSWDLVVPRLAEHLRVVAHDLRGHGRSRIDPPDAGRCTTTSTTWSAWWSISAWRR